MAKKKTVSEASASSPPTSAGGTELYTQAMPNDEFNAKSLGYVEFGTSGLKRFSGYIFEDFLNELTGKNACKTYKEMVYNDPVASSLMFAIKMMARKTDWRVEPASEEQGDLEAADFVEQCMGDMTRPWKEVITEVLSMVQYGHAPMEVTYKKREGTTPDEPFKDSVYEDGAVGWQTIALRAQETILKWEFFENGDIKGLWQLAPPYYRLTYIPWEKFLLFRTDYSKNNPEGKSILRGAYRPWTFKKHLEEIEAIGAERGVSGIPVAWVPSNIAAPDTADTQAVAALAAYKELVKNIRRDSQEGIVYPLMYNDKGDKMFDLTLLTTQGSETGKIGEMIERKSREMLQVCLAEFIMLGAGKTGSYAMSQSKVDLFLQAIGSYLDSIEEVFNTNALPRLFELNPQFKLEELPKIRHEDIKDMDLNNMSNYISKLIGAGAMQPDDQLSDYLRIAAGLPPAEVEDAIMQVQEQSMEANATNVAAVAAKIPKEGEESPEEEKKPSGVKGKDKEDKGVDKSISDNKIGNKYHDDRNGRFSSANFAGGAQPGDDMSGAKRPASTNVPGVTDKPAADTSTLLGFSTISLGPIGYTGTSVRNYSYDDAQGMSDATDDGIIYAFNSMMSVMGVQTVGKINIKSLGAGKLGYCGYRWNGTQLSQSIDIDAMNLFGSDAMWTADRALVASGQRPYAAATGYGEQPVNVMVGAITHEIAHAQMVEHVMKSIPANWEDPNDPGQGDKAWRKVVTKAAEAGWEGPSDYGLTNLAELYAESVTKKSLVKTSGNKEVDYYIDTVVRDENAKRGTY